MLYDSKYMTFLKRRNYGDSKKMGGYQGCWSGEGKTGGEQRRN